jgi:polysaccharide export outer membrane protein
MAFGLSTVRPVRRMPGHPTLKAGRLPRRWLAVCVATAAGLILCSAGMAKAQQQGGANFDLYNVPKGAKTLQWDWYTKDFRDLTFLRMPGLSPDYRMGPGDELQLTVVGFNGPFNFRIARDGNVTVPLVGDIKVAGLTAEEAEDAIAARLQEKQLLKDPEVLIYIASYEAKKFWIYGQVDRQGEYTISQPLTVMDAIFMAGGLDFFGDRYAYLHRRLDGEKSVQTVQALQNAPDAAGAGEEVIKLDLESMRKGGLLSPNPLIKNGDTIYIPTRYPTTFYVLGDVAQPGAYQVNTGERLTVLQAITQAGGPTKTARASEASVIRYAPDGTFQSLPVDFQATLRGQQPDYEIETNDIIFVPGSSGKVLVSSLADTLPMILSGLIIF